MTLTFWIAGLLTGLYAALMMVYRVGWHRQARASAAAPQPEAQRAFSIVVPARNEEANIGPLLQSIFAQDYPAGLFEVIVVDDHSTDRTVAEAERWQCPNLTVLSLADHIGKDAPLNSAKKAALALAISRARHEVIVTTDADCVVPPGWLRNLTAAYAKPGINLVAAPVDFIRGRGVLYFFQSLDFMAMQGITAAAAALRLGAMSNGANLSFLRAGYNAVGGYAGVDHLASGDDFLLTLKLIRHGGKSSLRYWLRKEAIVQTAAQQSWDGLLHQRIRWASKSGKYNDGRLTAILVLVYLLNVSLLLCAALLLARPEWTLYWLGALGVKTVSELLFLSPVAGFFGKRRELFVFPLLQPLHILYVVLAGGLGMAGGYSWKGRRVR